MDKDCEPKAACEPPKTELNHHVWDDLQADTMALRNALINPFPFGPSTFALKERDKLADFSLPAISLLPERAPASSFHAAFSSVAGYPLPDVGFDLGGNSRLKIKMAPARIENFLMPFDKYDRSLVDRLKNTMVYYQLNF
jgi:hypothetical protein